MQHLPLVAVVDSNREHRAEVVATLRPFYRVKEFPDSARTIPEFRQVLPDIVLIDERAAPYGGAEFVHMLRRDYRLSKLATLLMVQGDPRQAADMARQCGTDAFVPSPCPRPMLIRAVSNVINRRIESQWSSLPAEQRETLKGTLQVFDSITDVIETGAPLDFGAVQTACAPLIAVVSHHAVSTMLDSVKGHDNYTFAHSLKVASMLCLFGNALGMTADEQLLLSCGGLLHDIGKMRIPLEVLNKSGRLNAEEWQVMKQHVPNTLEFLEASGGIPKGARMIAEQHHEKLDGTGYPHGLKGKEINELARMAAVVDVYSALTDRRVYKPSMAPSEAFDIMTVQMADHLDQHLVKLFRTMMLDSQATSPSAR